MAAKIEILLSLIESWSAEKNIDKVLAYLTDDVVWHYSAITQAPKIGHAGAREFLEPFAARAQNPRWRIFDYAERGNSLFVEGVDEFDTAEGIAVTIPYMGVYEFRGDKICGWRDYFDRGVADRSSRGQALPDYAQALADRKAIRLEDVKA